MVVSDITIQTEDYAEARKRFHTKLLRHAPAPHQEDCKDSNPPLGVAEIYFFLGRIAPQGLVKSSSSDGQEKYPAVLFVTVGPASCCQTGASSLDGVSVIPKCCRHQRPQRNGIMSSEEQPSAPAASSISSRFMFSGCIRRRNRTRWLCGVLCRHGSFILGQNEAGPESIKSSARSIDSRTGRAKFDVPIADRFCKRGRQEYCECR
jgi:hypothetical protein